MKKLVLAATCVACAAFISSAVALADVKVSDQSFVRHDGGSDAVIANCSNDTAGSAFGGNRQQNEPAVAIDQNQANFIAAGANEYCIVPETGDAWEGVYVSSNAAPAGQTRFCPAIPVTQAPKDKPHRSTASTQPPAIRSWTGTTVKTCSSAESRSTALFR